MLNKNFVNEVAVANRSGAMEADTIKKNKRSSKSHETCKGNIVRKLFWGITLFLTATFAAFSQQYCSALDFEWARLAEGVFDKK